MYRDGANRESPTELHRALNAPGSQVQRPGEDFELVAAFGGLQVGGVSASRGAFFGRAPAAALPGSHVGEGQLDERIHHGLGDFIPGVEPYSVVGLSSRPWAWRAGGTSW